MAHVEAFRPEEAAIYAKRMVERESRGYGDQANALRSVGRKCGLSAKALNRLIRGERKDPGMRVFAKVRAAYLNHCAELIRQLEAEIAADKTRYGNAAVADLESEISSLMAKLQKARAARD